MSTTSKSAMAIGAATAVVLASGVFSYFVVLKQEPQDAGNTPASVAQTQSGSNEAQPEVVVPKVDAQPELAKADPETVDQPPEVIEAQPVPATPEVEVVEVIIPSFDHMRVDKTGAMLVSGRAAPNARVIVLLDGKAIGEAKADANGAFAAFLDIDASDDPRELSLVHKQASGEDIASADTVLVMPFKPDAEVAPKLVVATPETIEVITPPKAVETQTEVASTSGEVLSDGDVVSGGEKTSDTPILSLDTIVYDDLGDVVISGRGSSDDFVRVYLDNKPADVQKVTDKGQWKITLSDVPEGLYDLRVDSVDSAGAVTERVESPFKRETSEAVAAQAETQQSNITIQPGYTLWALAENRYGSGVRYVQIYEANRDRIKDPDLIYPGQVFDLPN